MHLKRLMTEWEEFNNLDWESISKTMRKPSWVFDTRCTKNIAQAKLYGINIWQLGSG